MKKFLSILCATAMTGATLLSGVTASHALPISVPAPQVSSDVIQVQSRVQRGQQRGVQQRVQRGNPRADNRRGFHRRGNHHYYGNHRGSRTARPGWRQHQGWWFPPAAFVAGAIIGGALSNQPARAAPPRVSNAHVNWCADRYRSYRVSDNSFQPYNGPRQQCRSPYY